MRILSVDDNVENLYLIEMIVRVHGHDVVSAHNGLEALDQLAAGSFDLIVSDVLMPSMDGFQLCRAVKSNERLKHIPFIFYTATYTAKQDEELGLALGASRFIVKPLEPEQFLAEVEQVVRDSESRNLPIPAVDLDDGGKTLSLYNERLVRKLESKIQQLEAAHMATAASNEEKDREIAQRRLAEEALARSHKLESIGRLAGGVAHDFNNLLTVITGYNAFLLDALGPGDPLRSCAEETGRAAERAIGLTKQLLAFSRKQVVALKPLNLNDVVTDAERMLQRLIGEDIELVITLDPLLAETAADVNQIHQLIMNLAVNARDAMPNGGKLAIETKNVDIDDKTAAEHPEAASLQKVVLAVSDTGTGMTNEVIQNIFDPFFTTKGFGKGTGLGLSTAYGIARQSGGWIDVSSTVGEGSTFTIYFPRIEAGTAYESAESVAATVSLHGNETLLVVEDEAGVRGLIKTMLGTYGYHVLEAENSMEAIQAAEKHSGEINLLLTDVILPGMNGKELSDVLRISHPRLKVLFMSGYTDDVIAPRGVLDRGVAYIPKPFSRDGLVAKIREVLSEDQPST